ncbi:hypothetical protein JZU56_04590, partial [bacterium]|nr:hypothetical protein [bacterium]
DLDGGATEELDADLIARGSVDQSDAVRERSGGGKTDPAIAGNGHEAERGDSRVRDKRAAVLE